MKARFDAHLIDSFGDQPILIIANHPSHVATRGHDSSSSEPALEKLLLLKSVFSSVDWRSKTGAGVFHRVCCLPLTILTN